MSSKEEGGIFKLIPRLGRRSHGSTTHVEEKSDEDLLDSPESPSSPVKKTSSKGPAPAVPPRARKTGWGDELKSAKQRGVSALEERFSMNKSSKEDDIPVIPDLDEIIEDTGALDISSAPSVSVNRAASAYKELDSDHNKKKLFSNLDGIDLSMLLEKIYPEHLVQEPDEIWTWDSLFAQVSSEINAEMQGKDSS